jgi:hypothetical protein
VIERHQDHDGAADDVDRVDTATPGLSEPALRRLESLKGDGCVCANAGRFGCRGRLPSVLRPSRRRRRRRQILQQQRVDVTILRRFAAGKRELFGPVAADRFEGDLYVTENGGRRVQSAFLPAGLLEGLDRLETPFNLLNA